MSEGEMTAPEYHFPLFPKSRLLRIVIKRLDGSMEIYERDEPCPEEVRLKKGDSVEWMYK